MAIIKPNSVAIITGGASGIGFEFVKLLVAEGIKVVLADLKLSSDAEQLLNNNKDQAIFIKCDVTSWLDLQSAFDDTIKVFGGIDLIVPNAGVFEMSSSSFWHPPGTSASKDTIEDSSYKTLEINITHPIRLTQMGIEYFMREKKNGHILLVSSIAAQTPTLTKPMYCASKAAISMFVRSLAGLATPPEGSGVKGVLVNAIAPGMVDTPLWKIDQADMEGWQAGNENSPFDWLDPEEIAQEMFKMVMTDDERYKGGAVIERTKGKTRVVGEEMSEDKAPFGPKDAPPMAPKIKAMKYEDQIELGRQTNVPVWKAMERMMQK